MVAVLGLIATGALALPGCSAAPSGSLRYEDHGLVYCGNTALEQFGVGISLHRTSGGPLEITRVSASDPDGVRIVGTSVVDTPDLAVGTTSWPIEPKWHGERPAIGTTVGARERADLVVGVRRTRPAGGSLGTVTIGYTEGGRQHTVETHVTIAMRGSC